MILNNLGYLDSYPSHVIQLVGKSQLGRLGRYMKISFVYIH